MFLDIAPQLVQTKWERPMRLAASTARQALQAGAPEVLRRLVRSRTDRHRSAIYREPMARLDPALKGQVCGAQEDQHEMPDSRSQPKRA